jgi:hypothetical protein
MQEGTGEHGVWILQGISISQYAAKGTSATTGTLDSMSGSQGSTYNILDVANITVVMVTSPINAVTNFSNMPSNPAPLWFAANSYESPPLSDVELADLAESEKELKQGKGKNFRDVKSLLDDLNED